ncbi:MAG: hypothetical protein IKS07_05345 [Lachnospiraceae bacterium]|nr:hypothetical protein [Lachnospiraceae bacterium]
MQAQVQNTDPEKRVIREAAWCVYWYPGSLSAANASFTRYRELVLFGCIYSEDHSLFLPKQLEELIAEMPGADADDGVQRYLSFINDVMHPDGTATQKSVEFLQAVLTDAEASDRVINDMIRQTLSGGFDGLELDYENMHRGDSLWDSYVEFVSRLYERSVSEGLRLRVILPVSAPVEKLELPEGPQYVVMCYNLYGNHSGPGPKADEDFLRETCQRFEGLDAGYALANGGFEWGPDGKAIRSLTAAEAADLASQQNASEIREESGALRFTYQAGDGEHTVVYGDEETIEKWSMMLLESADRDVRINLWRLE